MNGLENNELPVLRQSFVRMFKRVLETVKVRGPAIGWRGIYKKTRSKDRENCLVNRASHYWNNNIV
jgi:hypothetical protein